MFILSECFLVLTCAGVWRPVDWDDNFVKSNLYFVYKLFTMFLSFSGTISLTLAAFLITQTIAELTDNAFILSTGINVCFKLININIRRQRIINLARMLLDSYVLPRNPAEEDILRKVNEFVRYFTYSFVVLMISTVTMMTTSPLIMNMIMGNGTLTPMVAWLPYEITTSTTYWLTYIYQAFCIYAFAPVNLGHDTLICGFMMLAAAHFQLLKVRLRELPEISKVERGQEKQPSKEEIKRFEGKIVGEHIRHHLHIIKFAEDVNDIFSPTIAAQFCLSAVILSMAVYQMAVNFDNVVKFVTLAMYLSCMFSQLFMFCWFGNEVTVTSEELGQAIYEIEWTDLHVQTVKDLMTIMIRCRRPTVMSCGTIITLSLDSFVKVIKVTYSALNFLLQRSGH